MKEPVFSIILTCHNYEEYVAQSIESVVSQNYADWQLIIIDDASTDNSSEVIKTTLGKLDSPIRDKIIYTDCPYEEPIGVCHSRNYGAVTATGKHLLWLDADDYMVEGFLKKMASVVGLMSCSVYSFTEFWHSVKTGKTFSPKISNGAITMTSALDSLLPEAVMTVNFCYRREAFLFMGGYDGDLFSNGWEDWDLSLRMIYVFGCYPTDLEGYVYRIDKPSRSHAIDHAGEAYRESLIRTMFACHVILREISVRTWLSDGKFYQIWYEDLVRPNFMDECRLEGNHKFRVRPSLRRFKRVETTSV